MLAQGRSLTARYGVAVLAVGIALVLELLLASLIGEQGTFLLFFVAVAVSALFGGLGPGLMTTFLAALAEGYLFASEGPLTWSGAGDGLSSWLLVAEGAVITALVVAARPQNGRSKGTLDDLRRGGQRSRLLAEEARDHAIFTLDPDGRIVAWEAGRIGGYGEEVSGEHFSLFYAVEDVERGLPEEELGVAAKSGGHQAEGWRVREDGSRFWASVKISALGEEPGDPDGFYVVVRDVTGRKRIEDALRIRDQAIAASSNGIVVTDPTAPDNPITYVNPAFERMTGYSAEEVLGLNCRFLQGEDRDQPAVQEMREAVGEGHYLTVVLRNYKKDGTLFWNELSLSPVCDEEGRLVRYIGTQNDVTERQQTEEELRRSEERYRSTVEQAVEAIFLVDSESLGVLMTNAAFRTLVGYDQEELSRMGLPDFVAHDRESIDALVSQTLEKGNHFIGERRYRRKDGTLVDVEVSASAISYAGHPALCCMAHDITGRRQREEALRESEERFRAAFEQAAVGMAHVSLLSRWVKVNDRLCEILGYDQEELVGLGFQEIAHPDDLDTDYEQFTRVLSDELRTYSVEKRYIRKDGREIWVNQTLSVVREPSGLPGHFVCVVEDITERKLAAEALRESEKRFRTLVQNASDIIMIIESDGTIRYESPTVERVLGYAPEQRIGTSMLDYVHPDDTEYALSVIHEDYDEGGIMPLVEFRCRHEDGSWRYLEAVGNNMLDEPVMAGIVVNARDVTDRRQARDALRRSVDALLALYEAGQVLGSTLELEEIGARLLRIMQRVSSLDAAVISLLDDEQNLRVWHTVGPESLWSWAHQAPETGAARDAVLRTGEPQGFRLRNPGSTDRRRLAGLCLTLVVRDRIVGVLEAYGPRTLMDRGNLEILGSLSIQAASALENARLYGELAERERQLKDLVGRLITAQEEERRHVAYEVHDGLTQIAVAAYQHLQAFAARTSPESFGDHETLERSIELIRQTVEEARRVIANLRPTALDDFGLATAVRLQVEALRDEGWRIEYRSDLRDERLPLEMETALYRVAQEALTNVRKHAQTTSVHIELERLDAAIRLRIRDRGRGFDSTVSSNGGPGERVGLSSMRERIELVGGILEIYSERGVGSSVTAQVPLPDPQKRYREMGRDS